MSLSVLAHDRGGFRLYRGGEQVGWIEGRAVGFLGFGSADEARQAASAAYDAVRVWLARQRRTDLVRGPRRALCARHDGPLTWLTLNGVPIGRIVEPEESDALSGMSYGFELLLPPTLAADSGISAARIVDAALARRAAVTSLESAAAGA
jgi:hypothetical protein